MIKVRYRPQKYRPEEPIELDFFRNKDSIHHLINLSVKDAESLKDQLDKLIRKKTK